MPLASLFLDLNSYFASAEQHLRPELRGRPIAVLPVMTRSTSCIAVSIEAKRTGVKTGSSVDDAERLCPGITFVEARPPLYVKLHKEILAAIDTCAPIERIHSIDEVSCRLVGAERELDTALALAHRIKRAIATRVGPTLRCSIGIAPNRLLAKIGTDMQKPDGLVVIEDHELPHRLFALGLTDLPGIGRRMAARLAAHGVTSVQQLCALSELELERAWGSIVGRCWWHWLRGAEMHEPRTPKRSIGHQHVLPPALRTDAGAYGVAVRLLSKAAMRAREMGYWPQRLSVCVKTGTRRERTRADYWHCETWLEGGCQDTLELTAQLAQMWAQRPQGTPEFVDVTLHDLLSPQSATAPLFPQETHMNNVSRVMDKIIGAHGKNAVYLASMHEAKSAARGGIAFSRVPQMEEVA